MGLPVEVVIPAFTLFCVFVAIAVKKWADAGGEHVDGGVGSAAH